MLQQRGVVERISSMASLDIVIDVRATRILVIKTLLYVSECVEMAGIPALFPASCGPVALPAT